MSEFWILVAILVVGFILTWIICSKPVSESDWKEVESHPGSIYPIARDIKMEMLEAENYRLRRTLENMRYDRMYYPIGNYDAEILRKLLDQPVGVNIENIIKVESNETTCKSSCR